ncbi:MAG: hypothetical protein H5T65_13730 [Chloroflexi bacterium]|nr:hypothetical protein [Chloroflexota bacterium]
MTGKAGVKAGLVGGGVAAILAFTTFIPCLQCITVPLMLLAYAVAGALAAYWMPAPCTAGDGASAGAVAGAVAGAIGGIAWMIVSAVSYSVLGGAEYVVRNLPTEMLDTLRQMGIDPYALFAPGVVTLGNGLCCGVQFLAAVGLGALAGAIFGPTRKAGTPPSEEVVDA